MLEQRVGPFLNPAMAKLVVDAVLPKLMAMVKGGQARVGGAAPAADVGGRLGSFLT